VPLRKVIGQASEPDLSRSRLGCELNNRKTKEKIRCAERPPRSCRFPLGGLLCIHLLPGSSSGFSSWTGGRGRKEIRNIFLSSGIPEEKGGGISSLFPSFPPFLPTFLPDGLKSEIKTKVRNRVFPCRSDGTQLRHLDLGLFEQIGSKDTSVSRR